MMTRLWNQSLSLLLIFLMVGPPALWGPQVAQARIMLPCESAIRAELKVCQDEEETFEDFLNKKVPVVRSIQQESISDLALRYLGEHPEGKMLSGAAFDEFEARIFDPVEALGSDRYFEQLLELKDVLEQQIDRHPGKVDNLVTALDAVHRRLYERQLNQAIRASQQDMTDSGALIGVLAFLTIYKGGRAAAKILKRIPGLSHLTKTRPITSGKAARLRLAGRSKAFFESNQSLRALRAAGTHSVTQQTVGIFSFAHLGNWLLGDRKEISQEQRHQEWFDASAYPDFFYLGHVPAMPSHLMSFETPREIQSGVVDHLDFLKNGPMSEDPFLLSLSDVGEIGAELLVWEVAKWGMRIGFAKLAGAAWMSSAWAGALRTLLLQPEIGLFIVIGLAVLHWRIQVRKTREAEEYYQGLEKHLRAMQQNFQTLLLELNDQQDLSRSEELQLLRSARELRNAAELISDHLWTPYQNALDEFSSRERTLREDLLGSEMRKEHRAVIDRYHESTKGAQQINEAARENYRAEMLAYYRRMIALRKLHGAPFPYRNNTPLDQTDARFFERAKQEVWRTEVAPKLEAQKRLQAIAAFNSDVEAGSESDPEASSLFTVTPIDAKAYERYRVLRRTEAYQQDLRETVRTFAETMVQERAYYGRKNIELAIFNPDAGIRQRGTQPRGANLYDRGGPRSNGVEEARSELSAFNRRYKRGSKTYSDELRLEEGALWEAFWQDSAGETQKQATLEAVVSAEKFIAGVLSGERYLSRMEQASKRLVFRLSQALEKEGYDSNLEALQVRVHLLSGDWTKIEMMGYPAERLGRAYSEQFESAYWSALLGLAAENGQTLSDQEREEEKKNTLAYFLMQIGGVDEMSGFDRFEIADEFQGSLAKGSLRRNARHVLLSTWMLMEASGREDLIYGEVEQVRSSLMLKELEVFQAGSDYDLLSNRNRPESRRMR